MNRQRLVYIVAVLCLGQLAVTTARQFQSKDSELTSLLEKVQRLSEVAPKLSKSGASPLKNLASTKSSESISGSIAESVIKSENSRDPFVPFFSIKDRNSKERSRITDYEISELRLAAIISDSNGATAASLETADGKSFIVRSGAEIGDNGGRIDRITTNRIIITEPDTLGTSGGGNLKRELALSGPR